MNFPGIFNDDHKFPDFYVSQNDSDSFSVIDNDINKSNNINYNNLYYIDRNLPTSITENRNGPFQLQNNYEGISNNFNEAYEINFQDNDENELNNSFNTNDNINDINNNINNNNGILETQKQKKIFDIQKTKHNKKGRKSKNSFRKTKSDRNRQDDIIDKIKVIIINGIRIIINKEIEIFYKNKKARYLIRKIKTLKARVQEEKKCLKTTIKEIFSNKISDRYSDSNKNENYNKKIIDKIIAENEAKQLILIFNETLESMYEKLINNVFPEFQLKKEIEKYKNEDMIYAENFEKTANRFVEIINKKIPRNRKMKKKKN